jgi:hypothetical protein
MEFNCADKFVPTLDQDNPEQCIIRETEEEIYRITNVTKVMETYMSPGEAAHEKTHKDTGTLCR